MHFLPAEESADTSSQLAIILAKLSELDDIKTYLYTINNRLNLLQLQLLNQGSVTQRS